MDLKSSHLYILVNTVIYKALQYAITWQTTGQSICNVNIIPPLCTQNINWQTDIIEITVMSFYGIHFAFKYILRLSIYLRLT